MMWVFWFILLEVHLFLDVYIHILPQIWDVFLHWISLVIFFFTSAIVLFSSQISFGSFVYQFEHLFQTNLFLVPMGSTGGPDSKESTCNAGDLGWKDSLEESVATHSSILAWRIPMDIGLQRAGHEWATKYGYHLFFLYLFIRYSSCWLLLSFPSLYALWVLLLTTEHWHLMVVILKILCLPLTRVCGVGGSGFWCF